MTERSPGDPAGAVRLPGAHRPVALVTGPTSGIGKAYATRLAALGYDLVLVARDADRLAALAHEVEVHYGARAELLPADLARPDDRERVGERLGRGVEFLVNNAGFGTAGEFWTLDPDRLQSQLDVNVTAVMQLTRAALPPMLHAANGTVVNVASLAGLIPGRGSTYSASKAYVVSFSQGLAGGLAGTGVRVQALCPGLVRTEFHQRAGLDPAAAPRPLWLNVDEVVAGSLRDLERDRVISVPGMQYKAIAAVAGLLPRSVQTRLNRGIFNARGRT